MKPFVHPFKTINNFYVFDVNRNESVRISKTLYDEIMLKNNFSMKDNENAKQELQILRERGYFRPSRIQKIMHPKSDYLRTYLNRKLKQLTIQVTQKCNLRCTYCPFTYNNGNNRLHSELTIDMLHIENSLVYLNKNSVDTDWITIAFYGGEPLVEFKLVEEIVKKSKLLLPGRKIQFAMTTNGTLLAPQVLNFLESNNFALTVSIDGPKEITDVNRLFKINNNQSVFDTVMINLIYMYNYHKKLFNNTSLNMVIDPSKDFHRYNQIFLENKILTELEISMSMLEDHSEEKKFSVNSRFIHDHQYTLFLTYIEYLEGLNFKNWEFYRQLFSSVIRKTTSGAIKYSDLNYCECPTGPCVPGQHRVFLNANGNYYPCEKVSESLISNKIGSSVEGIDYNRALSLLNVSSRFENYCKTCFAIRNCQQCIKHFEEEDENTSELPLSCLETKDFFLRELINKELISEILSGDFHV